MRHLSRLDWRWLRGGTKEAARCSASLAGPQFFPVTGQRSIKMIVKPQFQGRETAQCFLKRLQIYIPSGSYYHCTSPKSLASHRTSRVTAEHRRQRSASTVCQTCSSAEAEAFDFFLIFFFSFLSLPEPSLKAADPASYPPHKRRACSSACCCAKSASK